MLKNKINKISKEIEELIKAEIRKKGLVKTGKLVNSIKVKLIESSKGFKVEVEGEDYFDFLNEKHKITEDAFNGAAFDKIIDKIGDAYLVLIEEKLKLK